MEFVGNDTKIKRKILCNISGMEETPVIIEYKGKIDGERRFFQINSLLFKIGDSKFVQSIFRDVTAQKEYEKMCEDLLD